MTFFSLLVTSNFWILWNDGKRIFSRLYQTNLPQLSTLWHFLFFCHHIYCLVFCATLIEFDKTADPFILELRYFGPFYVSIWNTLLQLLYLKVTLVLATIDYLPEKIKKHKNYLERTKGYIFTTFVLPVTIYVAFAFWAIVLYDQNLVPSTTFALIPTWINHGYHTNGMILIFVDLLFENFHVPPLRSALSGISILTFVYYFFFFGIYLLFGKWLYLLFYKMNWTEIGVAFSFTYFILIGVVTTGVKFLSRRNNLLKERTE